MTRLLLLLLCLGALAYASEALITPTDIDTCSNSTTDTTPQISRVQTCASASVIGVGLGSGVSFAASNAQIMRVAATACGDAVAGSIGELCSGADPMATIVSLARTCGTAMAALYAKAVTGSAVLDMTHGAAQGNVTRQGRLQACGSSCSNAQGAAEAFAQAAACGVAVATDSCIAASTHVQTQAFTRAFVKSTAESWGKACTSGGVVHSGGETIAASAAASIAHAMGLVAAQACANCPTCKCKKLPKFFKLNDAGDFSNAAATIAGGRVGLAGAIARATTEFCSSNGTMQSAKVHARTVMNTLADMVIGAVGSVRGFATSTGNSSWACGSGSLTSDLLAMKDVSSNVVADAAGVVYGSWCPKASAKLKNVELLTSETLQKLVKKVATRCTQGKGSQNGRELIMGALTGNKPLVKKIAEALTQSKSCGCKMPQACLWCKPGQAVATPLDLAAQSIKPTAAVKAAALKA